MGMFYMISYNEELIWNYTFLHVIFLQAIQPVVEMTVNIVLVTTSNKLRITLHLIHSFPLLSN